jgi:WD40 repeat protein
LSCLLDFVEESVICQFIIHYCLENESTDVEVKKDFGDEGHLLASASKDRTIRIWSTLKGRQLVSFRLPKSGGPQGDTGRGKLWAAIVWPVLSLLADASKCPSSPKSFLTSTSDDSFSKQ